MTLKPLVLSASLAAGAQELPRSPEQTVKSLKLPDGFHATLFAGEPDVVQPIGLCFDHRGRLWVAENTSYPTWKPTGRDRISVFEDIDGDGRLKIQSRDCMPAGALPPATA